MSTDIVSGQDSDLDLLVGLIEQIAVCGQESAQNFESKIENLIETTEQIRTAQLQADAGSGVCISALERLIQRSN